MGGVDKNMLGLVSRNGSLREYVFFFPAIFRCEAKFC